MPPPTQDILAYAFLALVAAMPFALLVRTWATRSYNFTQWCFWLTASYLARIQWRAKLPARLPIPAGQGAVLVCNHRSSIDPFFVQVLQDRVMHWMVAKEFLNHPVFGWFLRNCEVIPVNRGGVDNAATRQAIGHARGGRVIGMFPEGRINTTDALMLPGRPGAILIALRAKVPLIPCYLEGAPYAGTPWSPLLMRARARLKVGEPIDVSPYVGREKDPQLARELLIRCMREIARLAGHEEFEPEVAGRKWRAREDAPSKDKSAKDKSAKDGPAKNESASS